ncbi:hypothetical protein LF916_08570 [Bifidobacterium pseudolongum]|uniref:hypothetical protein n=1 Tax=Bifidobacterium pseudolongum TaxID=1694 RepID=UPI001F0D3A7B|nr:hypothetical protein [Bifidobacterium pseudolongum]MCH4860920.1 hypothetical protein [Bifidobacterium pseudolongum]MCH4862692.1 hypothetical protein [Bifidobacterium pseudolongum]
MSTTTRAAISSEPLIPRPELLLRPSTLRQAWDFGVVSADTYPFNAPYRAVRSSPERQPPGRVPRLLSIVFATLIHYGDPCWDPDTRTVRFRDGWTNIMNTLGMYASKPSRDIINGCLAKMMRFPVPSTHQCIAVQALDLDAGRPASKTVTLTEEYVQACQRNLREVSLVTLHDLTGALELDLYTLAALYAPDDGQLRIARTFLNRLLPGGRRRIGCDPQRERMFTALNAAQDRWRYTMDKETDMVVITGRGAAATPSDDRTVTLA